MFGFLSFECRRWVSLLISPLGFWGSGCQQKACKANDMRSCGLLHHPTKAVVAAAGHSYNRRVLPVFLRPPQVAELTGTT